jgi:hypothetical protein
MRYHNLRSAGLLVTEPGGEMEQVVREARYLVSPEIFDAAWEVATDVAATAVARVQSIRVVYTQLYPGSLPLYQSFRDNVPGYGS